MGLVRPKQINLDELAAQLAAKVLNNPEYKHLWALVFGGSIQSAQFSADDGTVVYGQTAFKIFYDWEPIIVDVYRNGSKLMKDVEYSVSTGANFFTVLFSDPISPSVGAVLSESVEIIYF